MHRLRILAAAVPFAAAVLLAAAAAPARAGDPPYLKLAQELGTPQLLDSAGPDDKSRLLLHFIPDGEDGKTWTKMTTISILKVAEADTDTALRGVIGQLRDALKERHAEIEAFDESPLAPVSCFFEFSVDDEADRGVVYSPNPGFVTVAQYALRTGQAMDPDALKLIKSLAGR